MTAMILVVDDEPDVELLFRQTFRRDLRAQRYRMDFAASAAEALTRITSAGGQSLVLVFSDINMPGMDCPCFRRQARPILGLPLFP